MTPFWKIVTGTNARPIGVTRPPTPAAVCPETSPHSMCTRNPFLANAFSRILTSSLPMRACPAAVSTSAWSFKFRRDSSSVSSITAAKESSFQITALNLIEPSDGSSELRKTSL